MSKNISSLYSKKVMEHFSHPRNMGTIKNPSGRGRVGNPVCGDLMELQIKVEKKAGKEYIKEAKFQTFGCGAAIATSSMLTDMIVGKDLKELKKISNQTIVESLDGLPPVKQHCSVLAEEALVKAIADYKKKVKQ
ncbi:MAG: iron-sulfur cluster assembly scaffold protein [Patescibacteria group bacterium]|nr:iron-sulfur cluster assembly scaffold protein [Patescibacteria group bacterium]